MFSMRNLKDFMYKMSVKNTHIMINKLKELQNEKEIDINDLLGRFTLDTFCEIAFGQQMNTVNDYPNKNKFGIAFDDLVMRVDRRASDPFWKIKRCFNIGENEKCIANL